MYMVFDGLLDNSSARRSLIGKPARDHGEEFLLAAREPRCRSTNPRSESSHACNNFE